jgi:hypothetical protein
MECEYCKQLLKTPAALKKHQNTAKYCLSKQNKAPAEKHLCFFCGTMFTVKSSLNSHLKICKANTPVIQDQLHLFEQSKKDLEASLLREKELIATYEKKITKFCIEHEKIIEDLKIEIEDYKDKMFILASKPTTHINTNIGNTKTTTKTQNLIISDWRPEVIQDKVEENFKLEHIEDGIKGVARFATKYIIQSENGVKSYQCTDSNREVFIYKDEDGVVQKDIKARKLKNAIKEPILKKTAELSTDECHRLMDLISSSKGNNNDVVEISNIKMAILTKKTQEIRDIDDGLFSKEIVALSV